MKIIMACIIAGMVLASSDTEDLYYVIVDGSVEPMELIAYHCEFVVMAKDEKMSIEIKVHQNFTDELKSEFNSKDFSIRHSLTRGAQAAHMIQFVAKAEETATPFARDFLVSADLFAQMQKYFTVEEVATFTPRKFEEAPPKTSPAPQRQSPNRQFRSFEREEKIA